MAENSHRASTAADAPPSWRVRVGKRLVAKPSAVTGQLVRGASSSFVVKIAAAGAGFGLHIVLARLLGASEYGVYLFAWTVVTLLALLCTFGFKGALIRFVSDYVARGEWSRLRGVLWRSLQYVVSISFLVAVGVAAGSYYLIPDSLIDQQAIVVAMMALPFAALNLLRQSALRGLKRVVLADITYLLLRPLIVAILVIAAFVWQGEVAAEHALLSTAVALILSFGLATFWAYKHLPAEARSVRPTFEGREWLRTAFPFLLISGAALVQGRIDVVMLGFLAEPEQVGLYGATVRITAIIIFGLNASNMIVAPLISQLFTLGKPNKLQRVVSVAAGMVFLYTAVVGIALIFMGEWILGLFGALFVAAFPALAILIGKSVIVALAGPVGYLATMTGHEWAASKAFGFGAALNIILNLLLIPRFGIIGAAWATALSSALWNLLLAYYAWSKLGIDSTVIGTAKIAVSRIRAISLA